MSSSTFTRLVERAAALCAEHTIPGVALAVWHDGAVEEAGVGVTSAAHPLPVTADTRFQIGSITKTVVATAVMHLVEQGRLDLDAPLRAVLPGLRLADPEAQERATLRHVFSHTGGWVGDYFDDLGWGDDALRRLVEERMPTLPQEHPFGELFSYNNAGYYLAGRAVEQVTGQTFEAAMADLVLGPLGMARSGFFPWEVMLHRFAVGHIQRAAGPDVADPWPLSRVTNPPGGIVSTVGDLLRYAQAHVGDPLLISAESQARMREPQASALGDDEQVCVTWFTNLLDDGATRVYRHGGGTNGQTAGFWVVPARRFAVAVLTNASNGPLLYRELYLQALRDYLGLDERDPAPTTLAPERLAAMTGRYAGALADNVVELRDGALALQVFPNGGFPLPSSPPTPTPPPAPLSFYSDTCALVTEGAFKGSRAEFGGWSKGRPAWLRFGSRARRRADAL
jgi:CubicO group peptidase (beta-lactamase class C family)